VALPQRLSRWTERFAPYRERRGRAVAIDRAHPGTTPVTGSYVGSGGIPETSRSVPTALTLAHGTISAFSPAVLGTSGLIPQIARFSEETHYSRFPAKVPGSGCRATVSARVSLTVSIDIGRAARSDPKPLDSCNHATYLTSRF